MSKKDQDKVAINCQITQETSDQIRLLAAKQRSSMATIMREAIELYLETKKENQS